MIDFETNDGRIYASMREFCRVNLVPRTSVRRALKKSGMFKHGNLEIKIKNYLPANKSPNKIPKILIWDCETAPMKAFVWSRWKQNVYLEQTISEWFFLSFSAKWLYSGEVISDVLTPQEVKNEDDSRIVKKLWKLLDEADVVVAHNGIKFDIPKANSRFIINGLKPPRPYHVVDTKVVAAKQFGFSSNKLDALCEYFGIEHKMGTDFSLWKHCMEGDEKSLKYMEKYNRKDTVILEEVYLRLRPWIKNHPNVGNFFNEDKPICSCCGSDNLTELDSYYYTQVGQYKLYRCECGALSRGRKSVKNKDVNKNLIISVGK